MTENQERKNKNQTLRRVRYLIYQIQTLSLDSTVI